MQDVVKLQAPFGPASTRPQDQPPRKIMLWWPEPVPYTKDEAIKGAGCLSSEDNQLEGTKHEMAQTQLCAPASNVYPARLATDEFRLTCLTGATDGDYPIHLELETYTVDNCPEYEAISYTWGGENGDSTLCRPIYVGPYWDLLAVTENCWEMLRFVRPREGVRMIWVDALCINQSDLVERGNQVAKTSQIYAQCNRVVVYLGPETAPILKNRFPRRRAFDVLDRESLMRILAQGYFSRIWVIQELILSPRAVIRFGDTDLIVEPMALNNLRKSLPDWDWERSSAPWVQYTSRKMFEVKNMCEALQLASNSRSTDSRDRLFGLLSLVSKDRMDFHVHADYSLSSQQMWIGFFAHCLLRQDIQWFLYHASGIHSKESIPSWIPDWNSTESWKGFRQPEFGRQELANYIRSCIVNSEAKTLVFLHKLVDIPRADELLPQNASVCRSTGALVNLRLNRLFAVPSNAVHIKARNSEYGLNLGGYQLFEVRDGYMSLFLFSKRPLDQLMLPQHDHIFILRMKENVIALVLREEDHTSSSDESLGRMRDHPGPRLTRPLKSKRFRMVAACPSLLFRSYLDTRSIGSPLVKDLGSSHLRIALERSMNHTVYNAILMLQHRIYSLDTAGLDPLHGARLFLNETARRVFKERGVPKSVFLRLWLVLVLWQGHADRRKFNEMYLSILDPSLSPFLDGRYVQVSIQPSQWSGLTEIITPLINQSRWGKLLSGNSTALDSWEWRWKDSEWTSCGWKAPANQSFGVPQVVYFRKEIEQIYLTFKSHDIIMEDLLRKLRDLSIIFPTSTFVEVLDVIINPKLEFRDMQIEDERLRGFTLDGRSYHVDII